MTEHTDAIELDITSEYNRVSEIFAKSRDLIKDVQADYQAAFAFWRDMREYCVFECDVDVDSEECHDGMCQCGRTMPISRWWGRTISGGSFMECVMLEWFNAHVIDVLYECVDDHCIDSEDFLAVEAAAVLFEKYGFSKEIVHEPTTALVPFENNKKIKLVASYFKLEELREAWFLYNVCPDLYGIIKCIMKGGGVTNRDYNTLTICRDIIDRLTSCLNAKNLKPAKS